MKKIVLISLIIIGFISVKAQKVEYLDLNSFKEKVWNYDKNAEWKYEGKTPAIIDFYADWCRPCKMIAPHLLSLQKEYGNKIQVYKVNVDNYGKLAQLFGIRSIPTLIFAPVNGNYKKIIGLRSKEELRKDIQNKLRVY